MLLSFLSSPLVFFLCSFFPFPLLPFFFPSPWFAAQLHTINCGAACVRVLAGPAVLFETNWPRIICDESQRFANRRTETFRAVRGTPTCPRASNFADGCVCGDGAGTLLTTCVQWLVGVVATHRSAHARVCAQYAGQLAPFVDCDSGCARGGVVVVRRWWRLDHGSRRSSPVVLDGHTHREQRRRPLVPIALLWLQR